MNTARMAGILIMVFTGLIWIMAIGGQANAQTYPALVAPAESSGHGKIMEGIRHYNKGHWGQALDFFDEAAKKDPKLAEAHYNAALCLDKLNLHTDAVDSFKKALGLAPENPAITESSILKSHLEMP